MSFEKERLDRLEVDVVDLKTRLAVAEANIKEVKEGLIEIRNDTKWLRRAITNAMIVSAIGGVIGLLFSVFNGGV